MLVYECVCVYIHIYIYIYLEFGESRVAKYTAIHTIVVDNSAAQPIAIEHRKLLKCIMCAHVV